MATMPPFIQMHVGEHHTAGWRVKTIKDLVYVDAVDDLDRHDEDDDYYYAVQRSVNFDIEVAICKEKRTRIEHNGNN